MTLQKNLTFAGVVVLLLFIGLAYNSLHRNRVINKTLQQKQGEINTKNIFLEELNTKQQRLISEKEWLVREIHHRVKNNLQTTMSLLNMQVSYISNIDAKEAIKNSQRRMYAMSLIHQKLYQSESLATINMKIYIDELVHYLKESYKTDEITVNLFTEPIELELDVAIPVGLIINESVTNCIKYAFPNQRKGKIIIEFKSIGLNTYVLTIADDGIGLAGKEDIYTTKSLGMNLIKGLTKQINGNLEILGTAGLSLKIIFESINLS